MNTTSTRANVVLAAGAWMLWVWGTRIWNILNDASTTFGFKAVHSVLAIVSVGFGVALITIGIRMRRERRADVTAGV